MQFVHPVLFIENVNLSTEETLELPIRDRDRIY